MTSRREFIKLGGAAIGAASVGGFESESNPSGKPGQGPAGLHPGQVLEHVRLGVATYSLRRLSRSDAIEVVQAIGTTFVNIKSFHLEYDLTPGEIAEAVAEFRSAGLQVVGGGTIQFREDTDEAVVCFDKAAVDRLSPKGLSVFGPEQQRRAACGQADKGLCSARSAHRRRAHFLAWTRKKSWRDPGFTGRSLR